MNDANTSWRVQQPFAIHERFLESCSNLLRFMYDSFALLAAAVEPAWSSHFAMKGQVEDGPAAQALPNPIPTNSLGEYPSRSIEHIRIVQSIHFQHQACRAHALRLIS